MKCPYTSYFIRIKPNIKGKISSAYVFCASMLENDISKSVQSHVSLCKQIIVPKIEMSTGMYISIEIVYSKI